MHLIEKNKSGNLHEAWEIVHHFGKIFVIHMIHAKEV